MLQIQKLFINYNYSPRKEKPKYIVIHDVGQPSSAKNNRDYFAGGNRGASADFFVDSSNIIQIIDYTNYYSWAIGDGGGKLGKTNGNTVSIEMCLESNYKPSEETVKNTMDLVRYLMKELNIPIENVIRHYDCSFKNCPQSWSDNNWAKWYEFKSKLNEKSTIYSKEFIKSVQHDLQRVSCLESDERIVTGELDNKTKEAIKQFRYIIDLPLTEQIDSQLIDALNTIIKKPIIGQGWNSPAIATKFLQWYLGINPKNGIVDSKATHIIKDWQVKAGIWSSEGADGVIREKDWSYIIK